MTSGDGYIRNLVDEIGRLEEAYSYLPGHARTPQMQRLWIIVCLRKVEYVCESLAHREGFAFDGIVPEPDERTRAMVEQRPRFYRELMKALAEVDHGGLPALFTPPKALPTVSQRDRSLRWTQARAAAILHLAEEHGFYRATKGEWAAMIAAALSLAGLPGGKTNRRRGKATGELTGDAVRKWLEACEADDHSHADLYRRFVKEIESAKFLATDPDDRASVLEAEVNKLCDAVCLHYGDRRRGAAAETRNRIAYFYEMATGCAPTEEALGNLGVEFP